MLEMLMLLGLGLVAAGAVGMTGIGSDGTASAETQAAATVQYSKDIDAEDGGILAQIRAMGGSLKAGTSEAGANGAGASSEVADIASEVPHVEAETDTDVAEIVQTDVADSSDPPEMAALMDRLGELTDVTVTSASFAETTEADVTEDDDLTALTQAATDAPADEELLAEGDVDETPEITDFRAGEETLVLLLPEDMDEATTVRIEPSGASGEDAAVVLEDAQGSVMAAVIKSGYGLVTPQDIELQR